MHNIIPLLFPHKTRPEMSELWKKVFRTNPFPMIDLIELDELLKKEYKEYTDELSMQDFITNKFGYLACKQSLELLKAGGWN